MKEEIKKAEKKVYPKYQGRELTEKQIRLVEVLKARGVDAFAKGRFKVINQAMLVGGTKVYPHRSGMDASKKKVEFPADIVEVLEFEAYGKGIEGEIAPEQTPYLVRVSESTPLRSRTKIAKTKTKKAKK